MDNRIQKDGDSGAGGAGGSKQEFIPVERPSVTEIVKKAEEALEHTHGGEPTAYCIKCRKRCEDCSVNCKEGFEWRYE